MATKINNQRATAQKDQIMTQRHPHADLIVAWANGAQIQYRYSPKYPWDDVPNPRWIPGDEYRVKPTNEVRWLPITAHPKRHVTVGYGATTRDNAMRAYSDSRPLLGVLRIEINPHTLELVSATMEAP